MAEINHLFVLMLENRSYDNIFGFSGFSGKDPRTGIMQHADDLTVTDRFQVPVLSGDRKPVTEEAEFQLRRTGDGEGPAHEFTDVALSLCGRSIFSPKDSMEPSVKADRFVCNAGNYPAVITKPNNLEFAVDYEAHGGLPGEDVLRCFSPEQLPVLNALAKQFVICDRWFSSLPGPTWPNRFFALCGSSGGLDHSPSGFDSVIDSLDLDGFRFQNGCLFDHLEGRWLVAYSDFAQAMAIKGLEGKHRRFVRHREFFKKLKRGQLTESFIWIEPDYDATFDFELGNSMHPHGDVRRGERLVKRVYEEIRRSEYWAKSALLVVFDEHGGFFDHSIPPERSNALIPGDQPVEPSYNTHRFRFDQLGVRVPAVIVSPWVAQGGVDKTLYDHTSIIKTVGDLFGLSDLNLGERAKNALSFAGLFRLDQPRIDPVSAPLRLPKAGRPRNWWKTLLRYWRHPRPDTRSAKQFKVARMRMHMARHGLSREDCKALSANQVRRILMRPN